jgi:hypothetical protein
MRRATLEVNYEEAWKNIFGPYSNKVKLLEALKCFKCDIQGLALICRIRLKDNKMSIKELQGKVPTHFGIYLILAQNVRNVGR